MDPYDMEPVNCTMDQGVYVFQHTPYADSIDKRSEHMVFDEITDEATSRDMYYFHRGELKEYLRNHPELDETSRQRLTAWVKTGLGKSIHSNPWYLWKDQGGMYDYLDALKIIETWRNK